MATKKGPSAADFYNQIFDSHKYKANDIGEKEDVPYADGSDAYANIKKMFISFLHVPSQSSIFFKAFITAFNESYTSNWQSEEVFGRADPIHTFKQTARTIQLSFVVPAASESEAYENLGKVQNLIQFLYPNYTDVQGAQTISQGPLLRLKIMNLLQNVKDVKRSADQTSYASLKSKSKYYTEYKSLGSHPQQGLLGFISSFTGNHNLENKESGVFEKSQNTILPKTIEVIISFTPIHEHPLGWDKNDKFSAGSKATGEVFPYGVSTYDTRKLTNPDAEGKTWDDAANAKEKRELTEQAKLAAEARYGGMFGEKGFLGIGKGRLGSDLARLAKTGDSAITGEEREYLEKTVAGYGGEGLDKDETRVASQAREAYYGSD